MPRNKLTKERIFFAAVDCFSEKGFKQCTMQEIAEKVDIKAPSIYKHFTNKKEILIEIFEYFTKNLNTRRMPVEQIVEAIDREPIRTVFSKLFFRFDIESGEYTLLNKIARIVMDMAHENKDAEKTFRLVMIENPTKYLTDIFTKLIELGKLKAFDYKSVTFQIIAFSFLALEMGLLKETNRKEVSENYKKGIEMMARCFERADLLVKKSKH